MLSRKHLKEKKRYNSYRGNAGEPYSFPIGSEYIKKDRYYMYIDMKPNLDVLKQNGIHEYENFYNLLHKSKLKSKNIKELIDEITKYLNANYNNKEILFLKDRQLKKSNSEEANIVLNRIACEYPEDLINFVENKYLESLQDIERQRKKSLIENLKKLVAKISQQKTDNALFIQDFDDCNNESWNFFDFEESRPFFENNDETNSEILQIYEMNL